MLGILHLHCCVFSCSLMQAEMTEVQAAGSPEKQGAAALHQILSEDVPVSLSCRSAKHLYISQVPEARLEEADARCSSS